MMTDPISDMLSRIRNAYKVRKTTVDIPLSRVKFDIAKILEKEGCLTSVTIVEDAPKPTFRVGLKYNESNQSAISSLQRVSKPGRRVYAKVDELPVVRSGYGFAIVSTPNGLMTNNDARKRRLGGEVICHVY